MIYTLTFNPAIDYYIVVDDLKLGAVNRTKGEQIRFGGKGINVSLVLKELGVKSTALGFVGGFTGEALENHLKQSNIDCDFVKVSGNTRINVKLNDTDINATGPDVSQENLEELFCKLDNLQKGDFLVLSGSVPKSLSQNIYEVIIQRLKEKGINFVVDAEKQLLLDTLKYKPFLIKPNHHELGEIFDTQITDFKTALLYAQKLQSQGAENVMVSMADMGAVLLDENGKSHTETAPKGDVISAVGAGDSAVAAFLAQYLADKDYENCLKIAVSAGSATAFSDGLANATAIKDIYKTM
ncbi:MAG: 1-phosphofructokinase [Clostridia bacterium]|nr:1-phosphofructokinase [Clostridia bacterium]